MGSQRTLWWSLGILFLVSFGALGLVGREIYQQMPPVPSAVVTQDGETLYTRTDVEQGRQVWQSMGGMQVGSVWGHGSYLAPDWSADWLRRESLALLQIWSQRDFHVDYAALEPDFQAQLKSRLKREMRTNTWDADTGTITVSDDRVRAIQETALHYRDLFGDEPALEALREQYAIPNGAIPDLQRRELMPAFFFWSAWAAATERPGDDITYTSNWPHEPMVGNVPTAGTAIWSMASILLLLATLGGMIWYYAATKRHDAEPVPPQTDPLAAIKITPSMRATRKYFFTVIALFLAQILLGAITAHYAVEGHEFYGYPLADLLPYSVTRTWHTQIAIFWIATAWLATGLYIAPAISGHEPRFQKLGVNVLFGALLLVVVGSLTGEWLGVQQAFSLDNNFWFGHQGWEYVDLGRFWQILLFVGLLLWLVLVGRALWPALKRKSESRTLLWILFLSTVAIGLFYGAGFNWGKHTHLSMVEYWRWWVVHLWVEGFFEVFATAVIALLFTKLGLIRPWIASLAVLFATIVFLFGGILGTLHHLYFSGTPTSVIAIGAVFSALEVVPLVLIGYEAWENYRHTKATPWVATYRWAILFFVAVAFWNMIGAGVFGFMINPPLSLYYVQGLNTTAVHAHAALFGVYGLLGIGLMLFCLRGLSARQGWSDKLLSYAFWSLNIGLAAMMLLSLLPVGLIQAHASITDSYWLARSPEILRMPIVQTLVWMRVPGDVIFSVGGLFLGVFALKLWLGGHRGIDPAEVGDDDAVPAAQQ